MGRYTTILNGGSLAGLLAYLLFLTSYYALGINPFGGIKFLGIVVPAVVLYYSMKRYKETEGEGFLLYGRGFLVGVLFTFVYSSLSAMLIYLHGLLIDSSFVDFFITENLEALGQTKDQLIGFLGKEAYSEMVSEFENFDLGSLALGDFQSKTMAGFILSLIIAAVLKQKPPIFPEPDEQN